MTGRYQAAPQRERQSAEGTTHDGHRTCAVVLLTSNPIVRHPRPSALHQYSDCSHRKECMPGECGLVQCSNQLYETCRAPRVLFGKGVSLALAHHAGDFPVIVVLKMHIRRIAVWQECYQRKVGLAQKRGGYVVPEEAVEEAARRVPLTLQ